ncbi:hypothetical protein D3C77_171890 [compost metagenome]
MVQICCSAITSLGTLVYRRPVQLKGVGGFSNPYLSMGAVIQLRETSSKRLEEPTWPALMLLEWRLSGRKSFVSHEHSFRYILATRA